MIPGIPGCPTLPTLPTFPLLPLAPGGPGGHPQPPSDVPASEVPDGRGGRLLQTHILIEQDVFDSVALVQSECLVRPIAML